MSQVKKVLVISTMYPSKEHPSFGVFVKNQVELLRGKGYFVDVLAIKRPESGKANVIRKYLSWVLEACFHLIRKGNQYDVIHAHYVFPSGWLALVYKRIFNAKFVVTVHGGDLNKMAHLHPWISKQTKRILTKADEIIVVGEELKSQVINDYSVSERKVTLLNMGVNRKIFKPAPQHEVRPKLHLKQDTKVIVYVGNLIEKKGIKELISAFQNLTPKGRLELHLIGPNREPKFLQELRSKILSENADTIKFHPATNQQRIANWLQAADVFVLPSHIEGFGLSALEAMACQTPVVGSSVGGLKFLLANNAGLAVEPKNSKALEQALHLVLNSERLRGKLIKNGAEKAEQFDQDKLLETLITLYHN